MFEELKKLLENELSVDGDAITPDAELVGDLGVNSLELADLILMCEEKFNIEINEDAIRGFITVGNVVEYLENAAK